MLDTTFDLIKDCLTALIERRSIAIGQDSKTGAIWIRFQYHILRQTAKLPLSPKEFSRTMKDRLEISRKTMRLNGEVVWGFEIPIRDIQKKLGIELLPGMSEEALDLAKPIRENPEERNVETPELPDFGSMTEEEIENIL